MNTENSLAYLTSLFSLGSTQHSHRYSPLCVHKPSIDQLLQVPRLGLHSNTLSSALKSVAVAAVSQGNTASVPVTK